MEEIKRFWIYSDTYGVMDECFTLVFLGKLKETKAECDRLNKLAEESSEGEFYYRKSYEVVKLTDDSSEIFGKLD